MKFALINKKNKLKFLTLTKYVIESIRENILYITLSINTSKIKSLFTNISKL